jgi:subtilase family serine protease
MFSLFNRRSTSKLSKKRITARRKCIFEPLETRSMLSANGLSDIMASPLAQAVVNVSAPYTPAEIRQAYGFSSISANGAGQTIAIVDAYDDPNVWSDLQNFDRTYGLSDPVFQKVNQNGSQTQLPSANSGWGLEIALDVEWAHAVAPAAKILLVEANSNYLTDLLAAVDYASSVSKVVSMSWGASEFSSETSFDSHFSAQLHPGVTFIASSGDSGGRTIWPSVSPNVLSVGGTSLTIVSSANGVYSVGSETSWSGSGGGYSQFEKEPTWQYAVQSSGRRSTPDVSYDANPNTGFAVYDTYGYRGWYVIGGTSAGAPQWAGLVAIVNQVRAGNGLTSMTNTASSLYALDTQQSYSTDFRDITSGTAGRYRAGTGYDLVTGLGSPQVQNIVAALGGASAAVKANSAASPSGTALSLRDLLGRRSTTIAAMAVVVNLPAPSLAPMKLASVTPADLPAGTIYLPDAYVNAGSGTSANLMLWSKNTGEMSYASSLQSSADANGLNAIGIFGDASEISLNETPAGRQALGAIMPEANSLGLVASPVPQADLAAGISTPDRRYDAVDAFMAQNSLVDVETEKAGMTVLPESEKTDVTLRAEALAAVVLMLGRSRLGNAKSQRSPADDNRWRVLCR